MNPDRTYLGHILDCIERIEEYTRDGQTVFMRSRMIQDAVVRNFEIVGEATKRLTPNLTQARPEIPWRQFAGFRDVLIHQYMGVDLHAVWNVVVSDLPTLKATVTELLAEGS